MITEKNEAEIPNRGRTVAFGTMIGATIEWYDFYIFGIAAALVFNKIFFPQVDPTVGTLLSLATFATAFVARPFGGIIFSHLGDRFGRKKIMFATLILMGSATVAMGLLPDYNTIGVAAPIILVFLRLLQGFACGGEWGAAAVTGVESAPTGKRGIFGAFPQMGVPIGLFLSTVVSLFFYFLPEEQLLAWGWRIPFLLTIVFIAVGQYLRRNLPETKEFKQTVEAGKIVRFPALNALKFHGKSVAIVFFTTAIINVGFFTMSTYILTYATKDGLFARTEVLIAVAVAALVYLGFVTLGGLLSDKYGSRNVYLAATVAAIFAYFPAFLLIDTGHFAGLLIGVAVIWPAVNGMGYGAQTSFYSTLFPPAVRLSGMSLGYQVAGSVFGGPLPLLAGVLVTAAGGSPWLLVGYISLVAIVATIATLRAPAAPVGASLVEGAYVREPSK
ncbi:MFS transporter [Arthrobacter sp. NPDC093139]|uniref:MFS transporter n=1 Tax=Arthrobacter sp. NPDC093139 TaxID=3363945 RepID=UPI00380E591C